MERFEVNDEARLAPVIDAVERGVDVEIVRGGKVVATVAAMPADTAPVPGPFSPEGLKRLEALRAMVRGSGVTDAAALVREMREADDH